MAGGWAKDGAVQDQIDASVQDAVDRARNQLPHGESLGHCADCETAIPEARRRAVPGVQCCAACQSEREKQSAKHSSFNRRGSKDSQLR